MDARITAIIFILIVITAFMYTLLKVNINL